MTNLTNTFDIKGIVKAGLVAKLSEDAINLTEVQTNSVTDFLVQNQIAEVKTVKDLNSFYHEELSEGQEAPAVSLLINNLIVYVFSGTRQAPAQIQEYQAYLEENDLYESEYPIGQYLTDNNLAMTFEDQEYCNVKAVDVGRLYIGAMKTKESAEQRLAEADSVLEKLKPIIGANFIQLG